MYVHVCNLDVCSTVCTAVASYCTCGSYSTHVRVHVQYHVTVCMYNVCTHFNTSLVIQYVILNISAVLYEILLIIIIDGNNMMMTYLIYAFNMYVPHSHQTFYDNACSRLFNSVSFLFFIIHVSCIYIVYYIINIKNCIF